MRGGEDTNSSGIVEEKDLKEELEDALSAGFEFNGKFAFGNTFPTAPNPGLQVDPFGLIRFPLSKDDAQTLKGLASQSPFGHGERLVVDTNVRHTWEIEASKVSFSNPMWGNFMNNIVDNVCKELGVTPSASPPKCELYKLLLYDFLPHQDTEKAPGMLATIIIVLPSSYTGGQVHVSHGAQKQVFDFSSSSEFTTSMLTWYSDVTHEVKTITSGYRLVLSYNLIHAATSAPIPVLPSMDNAVIKLKQLFSKWAKNTYEDAPETIAYLLQHEYSKVDLSMGAKALKGADAHLVGTLRDIAKAEGVAMGLAELECHIVGSPDEDFDSGFGSNKRARYDDYGDDDDNDNDNDDDDDDEGTPGVLEETDRTISISNLVNLDGLKLFEKGTISVETGLIPTDPFDGESPDDQEYEGYMGNYSGSLEYWYHRTVLVLYLEVDYHNILLQAGGNAYALAQLKGHDPGTPTAQDKVFVNHLANHLNFTDINTGRYVADLALQWDDSELWLKVAFTHGVDRHLEAFGSGKLLAVREKFGFNALRPLFEKAISNCTTLKGQTDLINSLLVHAPNDKHTVDFNRWCTEQSNLALTQMKVPTRGDVPIIIGVLKSKGAEFFVKVIQPQLAKYSSTSSFLAELVKSLLANKSELSKPPSSPNMFQAIVAYCLTLAIGQWEQIVRSSNQYAYYGQARPQQNRAPGRFRELAELCIMSGEVPICEKLLCFLAQNTGDIYTKYQELFVPLISEFRQMMNSHNIPLHTQPFGDFFRYLVEVYLHSILGAKSPKIRQNVIRKVGCGCSECRELDKFLFSADEQRDFRYVQARRKHLEQRLESVLDIVSFETIRNGSPHGLKVTKHKDVVAACVWEGRQKVSKTFLSLFGGDPSLKLLMGAKYPEVIKAVSGEKAYAQVTNPFNALNLATPSQHRAPGVSTSNFESMRPPLPSKAPGNSVAGSKRKNPGFVDLTVDSP
ncbi:hypothetical protein M0805_005130 [Coniferiporia weirii]|nr:hypothetical protein M0805_005130 [Coniferiporia weirii]